MKHVEYLKSWLVYGQDNGAVSICQFIEVVQEFDGGCSIETCRAWVHCMYIEHVDGKTAPHLMLAHLEK